MCLLSFLLQLQFHFASTDLCSTFGPSLGAMISHYYQIRQLAYGYQIVQVGTRTDGQVHSMLIAPQPPLPAAYLEDIAQQCLYTIRTASRLPTRQRFEEAQRILRSRVQMYWDSVACSEGKLQD